MLSSTQANRNLIQPCDLSAPDADTSDVNVEADTEGWMVEEVHVLVPTDVG